MTIIYKRHELFPESVLIRNFAGKVGVNDIIESWEYLKENQLVDKKIKGVINDLSGCELLLDMESFKTLIAYLKNQDFLRGIKLAVICNTPQKIIFPVLGENHESELKIKPFSTMEAAEHWVTLEL